MLLQCQIYLHLRWEIFVLLTEETSDRIKMQQYIDQNHLSKWKCYTLALHHTQGNSRFLHPPLLQQRWPHKEATWPGFHYCPSSPSKHPCLQGKKVLPDKPHRGVWAWAALPLHWPLWMPGPGNLWPPLHRTPAAAAADPAPAPRSLQWSFSALVLTRTCP